MHVGCNELFVKVSSLKPPCFPSNTIGICSIYIIFVKLQYDALTPHLCKVPRWRPKVSNYYHVREAGYKLRQNDRRHVPMARTDIGQSSCKIKGARIWNNKFNLVIIVICINKKLYNDYRETLYRNISINSLHFITFWLRALLLSWYHTYVLHVVW